MRRILVAGAGQIGSRYLQGLAKLTEPAEIWAYDLSEASLARAGLRWNEVPSSSMHRFKGCSSIEELRGTFDLAVVACTADVRPQLVCALSKHVNVRAWLLEKLLSQSVSGLEVIRTAIPNGTPAWVNTPMITYPLYQRLIPRFDQAPVDARFLNITGIACNVIHYVDFVARLRNSNIESVNIEGLKKWTPYVKRPWLYDVEGFIEVYYSDGSILQVSGISQNRSTDVNFSIRSLKDSRHHWNIFEQAGKAVSVDGEEISAKGFSLQSDSTPVLVKKIFSNSDTGLPTLDQSIRQHQPILMALLRHWNQVMIKKCSEIPIT